MKALTQLQKELLQRHYDGDLSELESRRILKLVESSPVAREFLASLEEVSEATRIVEDEVWSKTDPPTASSVVDLAVNALSTQASLEDLAPLLERFFDGEASEEESEFVASLIDEREEVSGYIEGLEELRVGVLASTKSLDDVDFGGFWDSLSTKLDEQVSSSFDPEEHRVLLYRFNDLEVSDEEAQLVNGWVDAGVTEVIDTLDVLREIQLATTASVEMAQEGVDFSSIWAAVEESIDNDIESQGDNVVSFGRAKRESNERKESFFGRYKQSAYGAMAAILVVGIFATVFSDQIFSPKEQIIIEKTVVIVDSVEYAPGSSVLIDSPVKQASAIQSPDAEAEVEAEGDVEGEAPTVIWILDVGEEDLPADSDEPGAADDETDSENNHKEGKSI